MRNFLKIVFYSAGLTFSFGAGVALFTNCKLAGILLMMCALSVVIGMAFDHTFDIKKD